MFLPNWNGIKCKKKLWRFNNTLTAWAASILYAFGPGNRTQKS